MKVRLYGPTINEVISSKSEITLDKLLGVLKEYELIVKEPISDKWFENLSENIIVYDPTTFNCCLIPIE